MKEKILKGKTLKSLVKPRGKTKTQKDQPRSAAEKKRLKKSQAQKKKETGLTGAGMIGLHNLKAPSGAHKGKKILGRGPGSGHGKTSTRGSKGQTSRAGRDFYLGFEGGQSPLIRRIPKRGFNSRKKKNYQIVNLEALNKIEAGEINPELLQAKGLIRDKDEPVKILGSGEVSRPLAVKAHAFSQKAAEKIRQAGGKVEIIKL